SWNDKEGQDWNSVDPSIFFDNNIEGKWITIGNQKYKVQISNNYNYNLKLVSLISHKAKTDGMLILLRIFILFWGINILVIVFIAYVTTKRTFNEMHYLIQVFDDAEKGIYPSEPKKEIEDEYDVIMNNIIYLFLQTLKLNNTLAKKQQEQEVAELLALQLQINPHFLFNTLQNVQFQIRKLGEGTDEACGIIDSLSDILKYALSDPLEMISLKEEVEYLKKYVGIQQFRFGEEFIVYYEIDEDLWQTSVFRLMLQPLVENSILHGLRQSNQTGYIKLKIVKRAKRIHFSVIDNGVGMTQEEAKALQDSMAEIDVRRIGLNNVNSRLKLYYGDHAGLHIRSKKGMGSIVRFWIPTD
ncbi:MAG TPA: histidine kinase, partial [Epulopiscium sp.]|nr:histidine kinase [Candidatus Epulonipiscium sp.]